jgi:putative membrane protein
MVMNAASLVRALREKFDAHQRISHWTVPIWLYVSVTWVVVYLMLYGI